MEMMKKMDIRKKALMSSMKDESGLESMMKAKAAKMMGMGEEEGEEGFMQMMVSPEEKEMIMKMRGGMEEGEGEEY